MLLISYTIIDYYRVRQSNIQLSVVKDISQYQSCISYLLFI